MISTTGQEGSKAVHQERLTQKPMGEYDLVNHHYNRRSLWGDETVWYRREHPMRWQRVVGNYQNWEVEASCVLPGDAESPFGEPAKLFYSADLTVWLSRRKVSTPYFLRNCNADELHFINRGQMTYETDFGEIEVREHDFLIIPKGVTHRIVMAEQDSLRLIYESGPELFMVPAELIDHVYHKGRPPVDPAKLQYPVLPKGARPQGEFEVRVKYTGAFSDALGEVSTIYYDRYPLDVEIVTGHVGVVKFNLSDIEKFMGSPVPFVGGAYLDNKSNLAWMLHMTGGSGGSRTPVHRNPDVDELHYYPTGPKSGNFRFTPQGVDHGWGRGYTKQEKNDPPGPYDIPTIMTAYTFVPLKGSPVAQQVAKPGMA